MYLLIRTTVVFILIVKSIIAVDVCVSGVCQCEKASTVVYCDTKGWQNLNDNDFPPNVVTLTLINNNLRFDTEIDRTKIENLQRLIDLSMNQNPLGVIPPFNNTKIQFLSLQDTSLVSAEFPTSYNGCFLQTISLSNNKIRSIREKDFLVLRNSKLKKLHIDTASIATIDQNAFVPLTELQSLSLQNNQLKSCEYISNLPLLSSIKLDGNQFTSLPQQLAAQDNIKTYSFKHNLISVIDDSSPLYTWSRMNYTNKKVFLANNSFDCCLSLWFIRFLKTFPQLVGDSALLKCATPTDFAGQLMLKLDPDHMNCGGDTPSKSWWTTGRIIAIASVPAAIIAIGIVVIYFVFIRKRPSRSGYEPIGGSHDRYNNIDSSSSGGPVFSIPDEDDDRYSSITDVLSTRSIPQSEAPTNTTGEGTYAADLSQAGGSQIHEAALLPDSHI